MKTQGKRSFKHVVEYMLYGEMKNFPSWGMGRMAIDLTILVEIQAVVRNMKSPSTNQEDCIWMIPF